MIEEYILNWFTANYTDTKSECHAILVNEQKDYPFTIDQIQEGCVELKKAPFVKKGHLATHIKLLGDLCNTGIKASVAGKKLREAIYESR